MFITWTRAEERPVLPGANDPSLPGASSLWPGAAAFDHHSAQGTAEETTLKRFYEIIYRYFHAPWDLGPREEMVRLVESSSLPLGCAIDLGCGTGANAVYLAQHGFEVTGVDFSEADIEKACLRAKAAGVGVNI